MTDPTGGSGLGMSKADKFIKVAEIFAPQVLALTPWAAIAGDVSAGIAEAELLTHAKGSEKLAHALNLAVLSAQTANHKAGRVVVDPQLVQSAGATVISSVVASINAIAGIVHPAALLPAGV